MNIAQLDRRLGGAALAILVTGVLLQFFLWSRAWVDNDQIVLLRRGLEFAEGGGLVPYGKYMSGGGKIPGALLQLLVGMSLWIWPDYRAPGLLVGVSHLVAVSVLGVILAKALGMRSTVFFLAIYWLSPWRLYHAGFLWEPGFVFLPAAVHLACSYRLRERRRFLASAVLAATIALTMQIHASFLILLVSTAILLWKRVVRLDLRGAVAGLVVGSLTLIPTAQACLRGELPRLAPARWDYLPPVVLEISNLFKGLLYWFRLGSLDIGRRIRDVAGVAETNLSESAAASLIALGVSVLAALALASLVISLTASWQYFRGSGTAEETDNREWHWMRVYALSFLLSVLIASVLAPVPVQGWHFVIALHAACLPVAFWLQKNLVGPRQWLRTVAASFIVLEIVITLAIGLGNPRYAQPSDSQRVQEEIPAELRRLFRSQLPGAAESLGEQVGPPSHTRP